MSLKILSINTLSTKYKMILNEWYCKLHLQCTMNDEDLIMTRFINDGYNNYG